MKKTLHLTILIGILLTACKANEADQHFKRIVFDAGNLHFISASLNPGKETMSALYGNQQAASLLSEESRKTVANAEFKLATFKYHENPQYTGGTITGELISIETLRTDTSGKSFYHYLDSSGSEKGPQSDSERIRYILDYKPVIRP